MGRGIEINVEDVEPMSRTYQYRKVMKPMLERKRRARINKCLDELKDLMVGAMQEEGESITKLEKADVLELTVNHLKKLRRVNALKIPAASHSQEKFNVGFRHCTNEVSKFVSTCPGVDIHVSNRLIAHLGGYLNQMERYPGVVQTSVQSTAPVSPITVSIPSKIYTPPASPNSGRDFQQQQQSSTHSTSSSPYSSSLSSPSHQSLLVPSPHHPQGIYTTKINSSRTPSPSHHISDAPPSPPLSVGELSPIHRYSPVVLPKPAIVSNVTDGSVWRPW